MKKLLTLLALAFCLNAGAQNFDLQQKKLLLDKPLHSNTRLGGGGYPQPQSLIALYDSIYNWVLDTSTMTWKYLSKTIGISYDVQQNQTTYLNQNWNGGSWVNRLIDTSTFNADNKMASQLQKTWNGTAWIDTFRITNTYDINYNLTICLLQTLSGTALGNSIKDSMTYDSKNNQTYYSEDTWNGSAWVNSSYQSDAYTYDANNNIITDSENSSGYPFSEINTYTYNSNNDIVEDYVQMAGWCSSGMTSQWTYYKNEYTYNGSNQLIMFVYEPCVQYSAGNYCPCSWEICSEEMRGYDTHGNLTSDSVLLSCTNPSTVSSFTYDANNNLITELVKIAGASVWVNSYINSYTYDANNLKTSYTHKNFNSVGTKIISGDSTVYYFTAVTGIKQVALNNPASINIYPNPNNGSFQVVLSGTNGQATMNMYDVSGKLVLSQSLSPALSGVIIDAGSLSDGIYFVSVKTAEGVFTKKVVVQH